MLALNKLCKLNFDNKIYNKLSFYGSNFNYLILYNYFFLI